MYVRLFSLYCEDLSLRFYENVKGNYFVLSFDNASRNYFVSRFDNASRFWVPEKEVDDQNPGCSEEVAALTRRSYTYAGEFVPVKWKCRAPLSDGRLCERMDRVKVSISTSGKERA